VPQAASAVPASVTPATPAATRRHERRLLGRRVDRIPLPRPCSINSDLPQADRPEYAAPQRFRKGAAACTTESLIVTLCRTRVKILQDHKAAAMSALASTPSFAKIWLT
jgi:hypothetical protein